MITEDNYENVRVLKIVGVNKYNPFSFALNKEIREAMVRASNDDSVRAIILTSGIGSSLSVGADFNELKNFNTEEEVNYWVDEVVKIYTTILDIEKPTIVAFDGYAIGMGFQLSMLFDYRIMSSRSEFRMPEIQHGLACTMGSAILEYLIGHNVMRDIVFGGNAIDPEFALRTNLVNKVVEPEELLNTSLEVANKLAGYPITSFSVTKSVVVKGLINKINAVTDETKRAHIKCFMSKSGHEHFQRILKQKY